MTQNLAPEAAEAEPVAELRKIGSPDYGHIIAECKNEACKDINGRPWQHMFSRRTVEGYTLAERDRDEHNRYHHAAKARS